MPSNNFLEFNTNKTNMQTDSEYAAETQRVNGVVSGIAKSKMHNKLFRQVSVMCAAIGEFIKNAGYEASDVSVSALLSAITNSFASKASIDNINTFEIAGGSATAITLTGIALQDGYSKTFVIAANNNGAATSINGKSLYRPGTTVAPKLTAGKTVTIWFNAAGSCFYAGTSSDAEMLNGREPAYYLNYANLSNKPTSFPANGGNSATVNGKTVNKEVPSNAVFTDTKPTAVNAVLAAAGWIGSAAPYSQDVTVAGVTTTNCVVFDLAMGVSKVQYDAGNYGMLKATSQAANKVTIKSFGDKPAVDIPVQFFVFNS